MSSQLANENHPRARVAYDDWECITHIWSRHAERPFSHFCAHSRNLEEIGCCGTKSSVVHLKSQHRLYKGWRSVVHRVVHEKKSAKMDLVGNVEPGSSGECSRYMGIEGKMIQ